MKGKKENKQEKEQEKEKGKERENGKIYNSLSIKMLRKRSMGLINKNRKFFEKFEHRSSEIIPIINNRMNPLKNCILALSLSKDMRNKNPPLLNSIESYLKTLPGLMNIISNEQSKYTKDEKIKQISINMKYEYYAKNTIMFKYGERGDKFYIILKGKIGFLTPKKIKCNLTEEEYLNNLVKYYKNGEFELVKNIMRLNQQTFDFGEDIEKYITETINDFYKRNKKYKYTMSLYKNLIEISNNNFQIKNKIINSDINIQAYIDMNKIINGDQSSKNKRPVVLFNYQYVNNYEDGQTFGYMALENRSNKRTSTAITITDCELASLNKEEYFELLGGVHHKTRNNIYDLISSLKVLGNISKPTFDYDVIHKIKFINYKINEIIIEENKNINLFFIFYSGSFRLYVNKNITGLNELIIKLKKIRGKIIGFPEDLIQRDIDDHLLEINGSLINKKYSDESIKKEYLKKHNFTISIISDNFLLGLPDTIDPETNLTLFNCSCISNYCEGYEISNKVLKMVCKGEKYKFNNDVMQTSLIKINYYINRIIIYKNKLLEKIKDMEFSLNKIDRSNNKLKQGNIKIINIEPNSYKPKCNTQINFYINNKNKLNNCKEKEKRAENYFPSKSLGNLKSINSPQTKNCFNLKFMSFPKIFKIKLKSSINPLKSKMSKVIDTENFKMKKKHKQIENIFKIKDEFEDSFKIESKENSIILENRRASNEEEISNNEINNKITKPKNKKKK